MPWPVAATGVGDSATSRDGVQRGVGEARHQAHVKATQRGNDEVGKAARKMSAMKRSTTILGISEVGNKAPSSTHDSQGRGRGTRRRCKWYLSSVIELVEQAPEDVITYPLAIAVHHLLINKR